MTQVRSVELTVNGKPVTVGEEFDITFQRSYKGDKLYLLARSDSGIIIMPENGSPIFAAARTVNIIDARVRLLKLVWTERGTCYAVVRPLDWRGVF